MLADLYALPLFEGFPYLTIRVVPSLYHVTLLPATLSEASLLDAARWQVLANRLPLCLVLAPNRALFFDPAGRCSVGEQPPRGGRIISGRLLPAIDGDDSTPELRTRQRHLAVLTDGTHRRGGFAFGDLTKGGRTASEEEKQRLDGVAGDGTPRGLSRCQTCGDWKGVCLDPAEDFAGEVMTVHCYCDNHNRCARCSQRLYERRLNANHYCQQDHVIWHVPAFCGLNHCCPTDACARRSAS